MRIGKLDLDARAAVVAEIGNNHEGDVNVARALVREAAACGADAVKFQTFRTEHYVSAADAQRFARLKSFELSFAAFGELAELAHDEGLAFISTPFDLESARFLDGMVDGFKVASGDNDFYPLLRYLAGTGKPLIVSLGLADEAQVWRTVRFVEDRWDEAGRTGELAILHCVTSYPAPSEQANLRSIPFLAAHTKHTVGYSDHTDGITAATVAVGLGARLIEKHFTLDKHYSDFRDHQVSADPAELASLVRSVREAEAMLGTAAKVVQPCEQAALAGVRRSIVAGADLPAGHELRLEDLTWIRPAGGLAPGQEDLLIGKRLAKPVQFGQPLTLADVA